MRFLCLHGMGTNSEILQTQVGKIQSQLPPHYQFDFIDGEFDTTAAEGVEGVFPGPFCCYYEEPTAANVAAAHEMLDEVIAADGPYDAVLGFSQGAALAASYLLHYEDSHPQDPPPFRLAVFLNSSLPFSISEDHGLDITQKFLDPFSTTHASSDSLPDEIFVAHHDTAACRKLSTCSISPTDSDCDSYPPSETSSIFDGSDIRTPDSELSDMQDYGDWQRKLSTISTSSSSSENSIRRFHPSYPSRKISIATAHIYGKEDQYYSQSCALKDLCVNNRAVSYEHNEGHIVPRNERATEGMVGVIERAEQLSLR